MKTNERLVWLTCVILIFLVWNILFDSTLDSNVQTKKQIIESDLIDFEGFDNVNGSPEYIVPNIIHFVILNSPKIKFTEMINIFAAYLNQKPESIYIHCDNCLFFGKYWQMIEQKKDLFNIIKLIRLPKLQYTIFGKAILNGWDSYHKSDVLRLLILMNYGGIYLDNDMFVINSLDKYRKFECSLSWDRPRETEGIGNQIFICHKHARFLKAVFDTYRYNYTQSEWYWNGGLMPAKILLTNPELVHAVEIKFGTQTQLSIMLYNENRKDWKDFDAIHLLTNHRYYMDPSSQIKIFDEFNIFTYNFTYGEMVRDIMQRI